MDGDGSSIPLSQLRGYRLASDAPDLRGWDVYSADGRRIGDVDDVLVDTGAMQVRYLDVEVEKMVATGRERHVLIPLTHARRDPALKRAVVVEGLAARAVQTLPSYRRGTAVGRQHPAIARPAGGVQANAAHERLELPIRVERPLVIRPIRLPSTLPPARPQAPEPAATPLVATAVRPRRTFTAEPAVAESAGPRAA